MTIDINTINKEANYNFQACGLRYVSRIDSTKPEGTIYQLSYATHEVFNIDIICLRDLNAINSYLAKNCIIQKEWPAFGDMAFTDRAHAGAGVMYDITQNTVDILHYVSNHNLMPILENISQDLIGCYLREHIGASTLSSAPIETLCS